MPIRRTGLGPSNGSCSTAPKETAAPRRPGVGPRLPFSARVGRRKGQKRGELGAPALCLRAAAGGLCRPRGENGRGAEGTGGGSAARSVPPGLQRGPEAANPPRGRDERPVSALPPPPRVMAVRSLPAPSRNSSPGVIEPRGPRRSGVRKMCTCFWRHFCIFFVC